MLLEQGMFVKSKAGRDKNCIYVIISVNDEYVYLADGENRPVCRAKKKNRKHVQPICKIKCTSVSDNEIVKSAVKEYKKMIENRNL